MTTMNYALDQIELLIKNDAKLSDDDMIEEVYGQMNDFFDTNVSLSHDEKNLAADRFDSAIKHCFIKQTV